MAHGAFASRCSRECVKTCEIAGRADVGGVLVTPRLLTCKELRGERATYAHSGKRNCRVFTQSREEREFTKSKIETTKADPSTDRINTDCYPRDLLPT